MARILLIDDDEPLRRALRLNLVQSGYEVVEASHGRAGLAAFAKQPADLVITDIFMPEADGVETIRAVRKQSPKVPIIAMSGGGRMDPSHNYLRVAKLIGANQIMLKPVDIDELRAVVALLLQVPDETKLV